MRKEEKWGDSGSEEELGKQQHDDACAQRVGERVERGLRRCICAPRGVHRHAPNGGHVEDIPSAAQAERADERLCEREHAEQIGLELCANIGHAV